MIQSIYNFRLFLDHYAANQVRVETKEQDKAYDLKEKTLCDNKLEL